MMLNFRSGARKAYSGCKRSTGRHSNGASIRLLCWVGPSVQICKLVQQTQNHFGIEGSLRHTVAHTGLQYGGEAVF